MAVDHETLLGWLTRLQLTAIRDQLDNLLDEAAEKKLTLREALAMFVEREVGRKDERRIEMAFKIAHFPMVRELADFDFKAQPSVDRRQVRELATSRWVAHGDALLVLGPPGVGKTHLAIALGREAIRQRYSVLFTTAQALMAALVKAHSEGRLEDRLAFYAKPKLLICDEMGYLPFEAHAAHLFFGARRAACRTPSAACRCGRCECRGARGFRGVRSLSPSGAGPRRRSWGVFRHRRGRLGPSLPCRPVVEWVPVQRRARALTVRPGSGRPWARCSRVLTPLGAPAPR